jgi:predicted phage terminase large subunit-like protein
LGGDDEGAQLGRRDQGAGVVLLNHGETFYVLEVVRGKFPFPELVSKIAQMRGRYPVSTLLIEGSPISMGLIQALRNQNNNVVTVRPDKDKQSRVISQGDLLEGGSIFLPEKAEWLGDFVKELLSFPKALTIRSMRLFRASRSVASASHR